MKKLLKLSDPDEKHIFQKIEKRKEKFCFCFLPNRFIHDSSITSLSRKLTFLWKSHAKFPKFIDLIKKLFLEVDKINE